jgi:hypothetical protein
VCEREREKESRLKVELKIRLGIDGIAVFSRRTNNEM